MTESPWANPPSARAEAGPRAPANWGFYLLVNLGLAIGAGILVELLATATHFRIPDVGVNIAVLFATVMMAGSRWLKKNGGTWTRADRAHLAFVYTVATGVVTVIILGLIILAISQGMGEQLGFPTEMVSQGLLVFAGIVAIVIPLLLWLNYGLTRVILWQFVNGQARATDADGKLL